MLGKRRLKIILFSTQWPEYMISLANALAKDCQVILMLPNNHRFTSRHSELISKEVVFEPFKLILHRSIRDNFRMYAKIIKILWWYRPDVLHIQANGHRLFKWVFWLNPRAKIVNTIHDPSVHPGDVVSMRMVDFRIVNVAKKYTHHYLVHGEYLKRALSREYHVPDSKISIVPHGHFEIYKEFQTNHSTEGEFTALFFGRIWQYKGLDIFIEAMNLAIDQKPNIKALIVGKGEDLEGYLSKIRHNANFKVINERVPLSEVGGYFEQCSVVVLSYIEASQSGVIPVAYAYKKPVISTNVGALSEVVIDDYTGYLVSPKSAHEIAQKLIFLSDRPQLTRKLGENAYKFAHEQLSWKHIARLTHQVYQNLMAK